ncbi:MAG TPA: DnaJ domain-containing protein [Rhodocyclaceae bacterium]|nr:DnaJ domain-containing protein [Rhodocyclaceae bacterium]
MSSKKSLYDLLEVSQSASEGAIRAAFDRLTAMYEESRLPTHNDMSQETAFNLIKDAFFTLGNPSRRDAYDARLQAPVLAPPEPNIDLESLNKPLLSGRAKVVIGLVLLGLIYSVYKAQRDAAQEFKAAREAQLLLMEKAREHDRQIEAKTDADGANARAIYDDQKREREERAERERAERERERSIADAENTSRRLQSAEENRRREEERKSRELQSQAREQQRQDDYRRQEDVRRAEAERQRLVDAARRSTPDRPKGVVMPSANPF